MKWQLLCQLKNVKNIIKIQNGKINIEKRRLFKVVQ